MSYSTWGSRNCAVSEVSYVRVEGTWTLDVVVEVLGGPVVALLLVELMLVALELVELLVLCTPLAMRKYAAPAAITKITITIRTAAILPIPRVLRRRSIPPESGNILWWRVVDY